MKSRNTIAYLRAAFKIPLNLAPAKTNLALNVALAHSTYSGLIFLAG